MGHGVSCCIAEGKGHVGLPSLLAYWTGADRIPPLGFDGHLAIEFFSNEVGAKRLPTVSTCSMVLSLPRAIEEVEEFTILMDRAILDSGGFHAI